MTEAGMAIMVIVLGGLLVVAGIGLIVIISKEKQWWERFITQILGLPLPVSGSMASMMPMMQQMIQMLMKRVFNIIRFATLIGGTGVSVIGIVLILIGFYIWS